MRRREFISLVGGLAIAWPLAVRAEKLQLIGVLMSTTADHPEARPRISAFRQTLDGKGWSEGRNLRMEIRWGANNVDLDRRYASELVALGPEVILAAGTLSVAALQRTTRTIPIVFVSITDPVGAGLVETLAHPGGNITGIALGAYSLSGKWLELLKEIAPEIRRAAVLRDAANPAAIAEFGAIQATAQSLKVEVMPIGVGESGEIERAIVTFAHGANGGLIITGSASLSSNHDLIIALAARYKLPAIYTFRSEVARGGLISYGPDQIDPYRSAADYVDRILRGEHPANLPVQEPTKYELVINLKTAKALGLTVPTSLLARADDVIE